VALADPSDLDTIDTLNHLLPKPVEVKVAMESQIQSALDRFYGEESKVDQMISDLTKDEASFITASDMFGDDGAEDEGDAPLIKLVNTVIIDAFKARASD